MQHEFYLNVTWDMRTLMTGDIVILQFDMRHGDPAILGPQEWLYPTPWRSGDRLLQAVTVARRVVSLSETIISAQRLRPIWHFVSLAGTAEFIRRVPVCHRFPQIPGTGRLYCLLQLPPNRVYMGMTLVDLDINKVRLSSDEILLATYL